MLIVPDRQANLKPESTKMCCLRVRGLFTTKDIGDKVYQEAKTAFLQGRLYSSLQTTLSYLYDLDAQRSAVAGKLFRLFLSVEEH